MMAVLLSQLRKPRPAEAQAGAQGRPAGERQSRDSSPGCLAPYLVQFGLLVRGDLCTERAVGTWTPGVAARAHRGAEAH